MTIKDTDYYHNFDLELAADKIHKLGSERVRSDIFTDALTSLFVRGKSKVITERELHAIVGAPDHVQETDDGKVFVYCWVGRHGPNEYSSGTPFLVRDGIVVGLANVKNTTWFDDLLKKRWLMYGR